MMRSAIFGAALGLTAVIPASAEEAPEFVALDYVYNSFADAGCTLATDVFFEQMKADGVSPYQSDMGNDKIMEQKIKTHRAVLNVLTIMEERGHFVADADTGLVTLVNLEACQ